MWDSPRGFSTRQQGKSASHDLAYLNYLISGIFLAKSELQSIKACLFFYKLINILKVHLQNL